MNVFKEAGKAATKLRHLAKRRDDAIARASNVYNDAEKALLRQFGPDVAVALAAQKFVHPGVVTHVFSFIGDGLDTIESDAGPGPSELDVFAQAACGGPAAKALGEAVANAPDLVPRAQ